MDFEALRIDIHHDRLDVQVVSRFVKGRMRCFGQDHFGLYNLRVFGARSVTGAELPSEMAFINEVLDALPDELCNVFLVNYFNDLYV